MEELNNTFEIDGGDYVENTFGLLMGLAFGAGVIGSGGLLVFACVAGLAFAALDR